MGILPVGFGSSGYDVGDIGHSLRFRSSASAYLSRTITTDATSTYFAAVKRGKLGVVSPIFDTNIKFNANDTLTAFGLTTTAVFRDPSAWYFIHVSNGGLYVNGVSFGAVTTSALTNPRIGFDGTNYFDGYIARLGCVAGSSAAYTNFGYLSTSINGWVTKAQSQVKAVVDAGGTNSFMLDFDNATSLTTLGYDKSSKGNNWTLNNISLTAGVTYDWMLDVPGNSFAVLTPIQYQRVTTAYSEANLKWSRSSASNGAVSSSIAFSSGKWYAEFTIAGTDGSQRIGIATITSTVFGTSEVPFGGVSTSYAYQADGTKDNNSSAAYGSTFTNTDVIGVAVDMDSNKIWWAKNGVWQASGDPAAGTNSAFTVTAGVYVIGYSGESSAACNANFGQAPLNASASYDSASGGYFRYTPPTGFKALCQSSLIAEGTVIVSGSFTGNASADGPFVWMNGVPKTLTINGNAVTFGTHADRIAGGFKLRTSSSSYNAAGSNTWTATIDSNIQNIFKYNNAEGNP